MFLYSCILISLRCYALFVLYLLMLIQLRLVFFSRNLQCIWSLLWSISLKDTWVMLYKMPEIRSNLFLKRWVLVLLPLYVLCKAQELAWISFKYFIVVHVSNRKEWKSCTRNPIFGFCTVIHIPNTFTLESLKFMAGQFSWFLGYLLPKNLITPLTILKTVFIHYLSSISPKSLYNQCKLGHTN